MSRLGLKSISTKIALAFALIVPIAIWALSTDLNRSWNVYRTAEVADRQTMAPPCVISGAP